MGEWLYLIDEKEYNLSLDVRIVNVYGEQKFRYGAVRHWRKEILKKFINELFGEAQKDFNNKSSGLKYPYQKVELEKLEFEKNWDYNSRVFVCIKALQASRDRIEANQFTEKIKNMSIGEIHFWSSKFIAHKKAKSAFRLLYVMK